MSRPKPEVLLEKTDSKTWKTEQIIKINGIWVVMYDNQFINIKTFHNFMGHSGPKYKKVMFGNEGHALNLAEKLNNRFSTDKFHVKFIDDKNLTK